MARPRKPADDEEPLEARIVDDDEDGEPEQAYRVETNRQKLERRTRTLAVVFAVLRGGWWLFNMAWLLARERLVVATMASPQDTPTVFQQIAAATAANHGAVSTLAQAIVLDQVLRHLHRVLDPVPAGPRV